MIAVDLIVAWEISAQEMTVRKEDTMRFLFCAALLSSLLILGLPEANGDEISDGRDFFIKRCLGCHAFACDKVGPRLGGLFGRKVATVEDYKFYSQGLKDSEIVWTGATLDNFFKNPAELFPESVMATNGLIEDPVDRRKLMAFLETEDPSVYLCPQQ